jgi:hypothetical protein
LLPRSTAIAGINAEALESLSITSYVLLEKIGRSRDHGEVSTGKNGLLNKLQISHQALVHQKKELLDFIVAQPISMKLDQIVVGTLFALPRFYSFKATQITNLISRVIEILKVS